LGSLFTLSLGYKIKASFFCQLHSFYNIRGREWQDKAISTTKVVKNAPGSIFFNFDRNFILSLSPQKFEFEPYLSLFMTQAARLGNVTIFKTKTNFSSQNNTTEP